MLFTLAFVSLTLQDKSKEWSTKGQLQLQLITEGKLDQLLADLESWPDGPPNWSEKARMYNIKTKGSDSTPGNKGQLVKAFLKSKEVNFA